MEELRDNGLYIEILMYWVSINSTIQPELSLIQ